MRLSRHCGTLYGWRVGWSGIPVACGSIPDVIPDGADPRVIIEDFVMGLLRKEDRGVLQAAATAVPMEQETVTRWPFIWSHLTQTEWEDGTKRDTSSLLMFCQDGVIKGMLRDRDCGLCLWCAGSGILSLLDALEGLLGDPRADWRQDRQQPGQKAGRVKKSS